ncbi:MAG: hypothetical protein U0694_10205 [Anaerolineae bacterium]
MFKDLLRRLIPFRPPKRELHTLASTSMPMPAWAMSYPPNAHNALADAGRRTRHAQPDAAAGWQGHALIWRAAPGRCGLLAWDRGAKTVIGLDNGPDMLRANSLSHKALAQRGWDLAAEIRWM